MPARCIRRCCCRPRAWARPRCCSRWGSPVVLDQPGRGPAPAGPPVHRPPVPRARADAQRANCGPGRAGCAPALRYLATRRGPLRLSVNQGGGFVRSMPGAGAAGPAALLLAAELHPAPPGQARADEPGPVPRLPAQRAALPADQPRPSAAALGRPATRAPLIVPNSLATAQDLDELLEGSRWLRRLAATPALAAVIERRTASRARRCSREQDLVDDIRQRASSVFHPVSTLPHGPRSRARPWSMRGCACTASPGCA